MHQPAPPPQPSMALAMLLALLPAGGLALVVLRSGNWGLTLLPVTVALFTFAWVRATRRLGWLVALLLWVPGVHLAMWLPFVLLSSLYSHGAGQLRALFLETAVTGSAVSWYLLRENPTLTIATGLALLLCLAMLRAQTRGPK